MPQKMSELYDAHVATDFYQDRYAHGYMREWPEDRKQRILDIVRDLNLPPRGEALDFGCGNGVLTDIVRQALPPGWTVYGADISSIAVRNARVRYPNCRFLEAEGAALTGRRFDFLFTHHVLEHVFDLSCILDQIDGCLAQNAVVLHILPCGNAGSLEHSICLLRKDGIDSQMESRFFFEDEGHVRRLTTDQLSTLYRARGYDLVQEYYNAHYYGTVDRVTQYGPAVVRELTDSSRAVDGSAARVLRKLRNRLLGLWALRQPAAIVEGKLTLRGRSLRDYALLAAGLPLYVVAKPVDLLLRAKARWEWTARRTQRNGSEMYLLFRRQAARQAANAGAT
jgi:SAM-dependent methyltransferase